MPHLEGTDTVAQGRRSERMAWPHHPARAGGGRRGWEFRGWTQAFQIRQPPASTPSVAFRVSTPRREFRTIQSYLYREWSVTMTTQSWAVSRSSVRGALCIRILWCRMGGREGMKGSL